MQTVTSSQILSIGLAIFSMLFGAGNLIYPLAVGMSSGSNNPIGMLGFLLTAICLPMMGLIAMILFEGDYQAFFKRLGSIPGSLLIFACMMIIGPVIAIPRIVTLSHTMVAPFLPCSLFSAITPLSSFVFAIVFLGITFIGAYKENRIVDLLGYIVSPILLISLMTIMIKGILTADFVVPTTRSMQEIFTINFVRGYETLDLLATIFFSSIVIHILRSLFGGNSDYNYYTLAKVGLKAGCIGVGLLASMYIGMSIVGMYHGHGLQYVNAGELFSAISFRILGSSGAAIISTTVLVTCISTAIALAAVIGEYIQITLSNSKLSYQTSVILALIACIPLSSGLLNVIASAFHNAPIKKAALDYVLEITGGPVLYIGYPVIITLTLCNIAYKLWNFKPVKIPVLLTFIITTISYLL